MSKVRINDLARELEVKSKEILDALTAVGVTEKKTHSSSIEDDEADKVRGHLTGGRSSARSGGSSAEVKQKVDLSRASKPGDVLRAIQERKQAEQAAASRPAVAPPQSPRPAVVAVAPPKPAVVVAPAAPVAPVVVAPAAAPVVVPPAAPAPAAAATPAAPVVAVAPV